MKALVIGGSSSGKSMLAQKIARFLAEVSASPLVYFATMKATDIEDNMRIAKHVKEREGWGFSTIECGNNIVLHKNKVEDTTVLLDSTTALLSNEMFAGKGFNNNAHSEISNHISTLSECACNIVVVGDNIFEDSNFYDSYSTAFIKGLGELHSYLAHFFDIVIEVSSGLPIIHKGKELQHYVFAALQ